MEPCSLSGRSRQTTASCTPAPTRARTACPPTASPSVRTPDETPILPRCTGIPGRSRPSRQQWTPTRPSSPCRTRHTGSVPTPSPAPRRSSTPESAPSRPRRRRGRSPTGTRPRDAPTARPQPSLDRSRSYNARGPLEAPRTGPHRGGPRRSQPRPAPRRPRRPRPFARPAPAPNLQGRAKASFTDPRPRRDRRTPVRSVQTGPTPRRRDEGPGPRNQGRASPAPTARPVRRRPRAPRPEPTRPSPHNRKRLRRMLRRRRLWRRIGDLNPGEAVKPQPH